MRATPLISRAPRLTDVLINMNTSLDCGADFIGQHCTGNCKFLQVNIRLILVFGSELLFHFSEPLPEILHRQEHNFVA
jgi:hypothetical protein